MKINIRGVSVWKLQCYIKCAELAHPWLPAIRFSLVWDLCFAFLDLESQISEPDPDTLSVSSILKIFRQAIEAHPF